MNTSPPSLVTINSAGSLGHSSLPFNSLSAEPAEDADGKSGETLEYQVEFVRAAKMTIIY